MLENDHTITIEWPWTMIPLDSADEWADFIQKQVGPGHPLHNKNIFASMRREDGIDMVLFDNYTDGTYAIVYLHEKKRYKSRLMPKTEVIATWSEVKQRLKRDHEEAMRKIEKDKTANNAMRSDRQGRAV